MRTKAVTGPTPVFASGNATVTIQAGQDRTYTLKVAAPTFDAGIYGYTQPAAKAITIKNDGNSAATIASVTVSGGDFTIGGSGSSVAAGGSITSWTVQPNTELAVGTHTGTITVTYDGGATATADVSFTVSKATLTPTPNANNKTYDGTTTATGTINLTGVNGETPTASGTFAFEDANAGTGKTVKVTNITLDDGWGTNYQLSSNSTTTTATIEPKSISGATVTLGDSLTYTGSQQAQTVSSVTIDNLTATYAVSNNQQTNAGTYTLTVTGTGNFTGTQSAQFAIAKASNSITSLTCDNIVFGETPDPSATAAFGTVTYTYSQQENGTYGAWSASNDVGKWYVKAAVTGTDNYDGAEATASFQVTAQREETPSAAISCSDETLTGLTADASYSITPADGTAVTVPADSSGRIVIQEGWFGKALSIVKIARDGDYSDSEAQSLPIPARPAAPSTKITVKKTDTSITITNKADFGDCEFSIDRTNWQDSEVFTGLSAGQTYPVSVRTKATGTVFASASQTVNVTTVKANGPTTVKPGESAEVGTSPKTTVTNDGEKVTITTGGTTTTVTPAGEVEVGTGGGVTVPGNSTVKPGNGGPEITVGPGSGGTIGGNGEITIPGGGTAQIDTSPSTTITVPEGGGTIQPKPGGTVDVPGGSTIKTGDNGPEITIGPENGGTVGSDGGITVPSGGTVQVGKDPATTVTPPPGGEVKPKEDGTVEVPEGTIVKPGGGGPEVTVGPGNGGTVGDDGGVTVPGGGKVTIEGDPDTTIILPSGGGTVKPTEGGGITIPGGSTVQTGDTTITIPEGGGEVKPTEGGGVTVPGGSTIKPGNGGPEVKLPQGGTIGGDGGITIPGGGTAQVGTSPSTTITVPEGGGTIQTKPGGTVEVPGGSTIKTGDDGPEITVGPGNGGTIGGSGGVTVPEGGTIQIGKNPATTVTPPPGGEVKPKGDGTVEVPEGTTVKPGGGGPEVTVGPGNGGTIGDDGGVTVEGGGKVTVKGDPDDTTITLPSGGGTVKPNPDGTIPLPGGTTVEKGGTTTDVPDTGGTYDPSTGEIKQNVYAVAVNGGTGGGSYAVGATVTITATVPSGQRFTGWTVNAGGVTLANASSATTTFTMPAQAVTVTANFQNNSGGGDGGGYVPPTYPPAVEQPKEGGSVAISPSNPKRGDTVTIIPKPDEGYEVDKITVTDQSGKPVTVTAKPGGTYSFIQPSGRVKIEVTYKPAKTPWSNPFTDVPDGAWYYDAVQFVSENGLMGGYGNGLFGPNDTLSRAQLAQILFNKEGRPVVNYLLQYGDVSTGTWYTEAVRWATSQGIVGGYGNGNFGPNDPITREQLAVMLWRYNGNPAATNKELHFNDAEEASEWAKEALRWAVENGIINGYGDGRLGPQGLATRAQVAQMLKNFLDNQK